MNKLPDWLFTQIIRNLPSEEWSKLSLVCKKWREIILKSIGISVYLLDPPCFYSKDARWPSVPQPRAQYNPFWKCIVGETDLKTCHLKRPDLLRVLKLNGRISRVCYMSLFQSLKNLDFLSIDICTFYHLRRDDLLFIDLPRLTRLRVTCESVRKGNPFSDIRVEGQALGLITLLHNEFPSLKSLSVNYPHYIGLKSINKRIFQGLVKAFEINRASLRRVWITNQDVSIKIPHADFHYADNTWDRYSPILQNDGKTLPMIKLEEFYIDLDSVEDSRIWKNLLNKQLHFTRLSDIYLHVSEPNGYQKRWQIIPNTLKSNHMSLTQVNLTDLVDFVQIAQDPSAWDVDLAVGLGAKKPPKTVTKAQIMSNLLPPHHPQRLYQKRQTSRLIKNCKFLDISFLKDLINLRKVSLDGGSIILEEACNFGSLVLCGVDKIPTKSLESIEIRNLLVDLYDVKILLSQAKFPRLSHLKLVNIGEYSDFGIDAFDFIQVVRGEPKFLKEIVIHDGINWESWNFHCSLFLENGQHFDKKSSKEGSVDGEKCHGHGTVEQDQDGVESDMDILQRVLKRQDKQIALRLVEKVDKSSYIDFDLTESYLRNKLAIIRPQGESIPEFYDASNRKFGMI